MSNHGVVWYDVESTPPIYKKQVLLRYRKGKNIVITQGYLTDVAEDTAGRRNGNDSGDRTSNPEFWRDCGYGKTYFDYADRQIQSLVAKTSKNVVLQWAEIPY